MQRWKEGSSRHTLAQVGVHPFRTLLLYIRCFAVGQLDGLRSR